jgi:hypothetical protein
VSHERFQRATNSTGVTNKASSAVRRITRDKSLDFIGSASARDARVGGEADAEALSITRLREAAGGAAALWSYKGPIRRSE